MFLWWSGGYPDKVVMVHRNIVFDCISPQSAYYIGNECGRVSKYIANMSGGVRQIYGEYECGRAEKYIENGREGERAPNIENACKWGRALRCYGVRRYHGEFSP